MNVLEMLYAGVIAGAIAGVGYLMKQAFEGMNAKLDSQGRKLDSNCADVAEIKSDMNGYRLLAEYQEKRIQQQESKIESLVSSHAAIDKFIAVQQALQRKPSNN